MDPNTRYPDVPSEATANASDALEKADERQGLEQQAVDDKAEQDDQPHTSAFKGLGWLDRLLALWILLAMAVGILLGYFVPSTAPTLQKGQFVGVSVPIGSFTVLVSVAYD